MMHFQGHCLLPQLFRTVQVIAPGKNDCQGNGWSLTLIPLKELKFDFSVVRYFKKKEELFDVCVSCTLDSANSRAVSKFHCEGKKAHCGLTFWLLPLASPYGNYFTCDCSATNADLDDSKVKGWMSSSNNPGFV
mmetsp:Transcript_6607/g.9650  ORF Transcript_6607/g.9650 Transcript_6607/m.9650 type:complete len:134 (-) Transcript_6607:752-1153(-)